MRTRFAFLAALTVAALVALPAAPSALATENQGPGPPWFGRERDICGPRVQRRRIRRVR